MRHYFFGDIHGNPYALKACLREAEKLKADRLYCLGDIIGWLPWGEETLKMVLDLGIPTIAGNHELLVAGIFTDDPKNVDRIQATAYTAGVLWHRENLLSELDDFPLIIAEEDFVLVHHDPFVLPESRKELNIEHFTYLDDDKVRSIIPRWKQYSYRLIFSGHDHVPMLFELREDGSVTRHPVPLDFDIFKVSLETGSKYWFKAGAVGGPYRDGVAMANALLYDDDEKSVIFVRCSFDRDELFERLRSHRYFRNINTIQKYLRNLKL